MTESLYGRTVEVLGLPGAVDEELLSLYFENKRRSGGGPLVSVEKSGDCALLVFEDAEVAAQVLSKEHHVLHNVEISVRRPATKDPCRLLLKGLNPTTGIDMVELYVENLMGLSESDYTLHPSPDRDLILIQLSQPLEQDFQKLSTKISKRQLNGAVVSLEQVTETDSVLVENIHPGTTADMVTLYFESQRGGAQQVKEVVVLSEGMTKVTFVSYESMSVVLGQPHKLEGVELSVRPYFDFLQPKEAASLQDSEVSGNIISEPASEGKDDIQMQISTPTLASLSELESPTASHGLLEPPMAFHSLPEPTLSPAATPSDTEEVMETQTEEVQIVTEHIAIPDLAKLTLFQKSSLPRDSEKAHPDYKIIVNNDRVQVTGPVGPEMDQIKCTIMDFILSLAEISCTLDQDQAQFLAQKDVKDHLLQTINQAGSPTLYTILDSDVSVTSVSEDSAKQACSFLKSQLCRFSMQVDPKYESMLYCREWSEFCQALGFVKVSERGGNIDVLTLKGMEGKKRAAILTFLTTPIERETFIPMEPGRLKYIQIHSHQLLADMTEVSIFPIESQDVCGLKIHGHPTACQTAEELLRGVVENLCTKAITINVPGVTRFLDSEDCQKIFKEMETKFQVYISPELVPWEPPQNKDMFESAWKVMADKNFHFQTTPDGLQQDFKANAMQTDHTEADRSLLVEAKKIVSAIEESPEEPVFDQLEDMDSVDLYTAEEPTSPLSLRTDVIVVDESQPSESPSLQGAMGFSSDLEEEAQLSLAIQYSMESNQWPMEDEEEQLQKALELSRMVHQEEEETQQQEEASKLSLQDAIKSANTLKLVVFAGYNSDLLRVDIAFGKKVAQRQDEQKLEHRCVKYISEFHKTCLDVIRRNHAVKIEITGTIICVSGFKEYVAEAIPNVKLLLEKIAASVSDREVLRTVEWAQHGPSTLQKRPYPSDLTVLLENAWRMRLKTVDILLDNHPHIMNIEKMEAHNIASGVIVKITRQLVKVEDMSEDLPEDNYSQLSNMPEATKVDEESEEFQDVVKNFYGTIQEFHSKIRIIKVEKLMNRLLYNQYKLKKASIQQAAIYPEVERTLYHGTSESSVKEICVHGFNRSFCGKNATVYGQGVYFAVNSALSVSDQYSPPNAAGHKFIFVAKVLTGDYTKGDHSMKTAPLKETGNIPLRYDSVTDDITRPSMFIIFNDTQAFPEYIITCERIYRH